MRIVITGASGHIGNNLVRYLNVVMPEAEIFALNRRKVERELEGAKCRQIVGDIENKDFLRAKIREGDIVVHLAGVIDLKNNKHEESYRINYLFAKNICDISREKNVSKFVYVGSVDGIYREGEGEIVEPSEYYPEKMEGNYAKTKSAATKYVLEQMNLHKNFNAGIILPTAVIGIHDYKPSAVGRVILNTLKGKSQFGISGGYNFVDVRDVCDGIYRLINSACRGQYILSGHNVSVKELYNFINNYKSLKKKPIIIPTWLAKMACPFVSVLNKITLKALQEPHNYSSVKAERELGYKARTLQQTLKDTVDWFDKHKKMINI